MCVLHVLFGVSNNLSCRHPVVLVIIDKCVADVVFMLGTSA